MSEHLALTEVPQQGEILLDKYRVDRVLGRGGMGVVLAATHLQLDDRFAIKFLLPHTLEKPDLVKRFLREAQASTRIRSEHVVRVFDVGTLPSGLPYIVMEYLDGNDLGCLVETGGPLSVSDAVDYVLQACEAIAEAHALGIIHRDLKPTNLFVTHRAGGHRVVKVLDFGISKVGSESGSATLTQTSQVMGSPRYMSPEQMRSARATDMRSDIWALGTIVHELLTGKPAFGAETMTELCAQILQDPSPHVRTVRPDVPHAIDDAIARCLEKDPAARFQSVAHVAHAIAPFGSAEAARSADQIIRVLRAAGLDVSPPNYRASAPTAEPIASSTKLPPHVSVAEAPRSTADVGVTTAHPLISYSISQRSLAKGRSPLRWVLGGVVVIGAAAALTIVGLRGASSYSSAASPPPPASSPLEPAVPMHAPPHASAATQPVPYPARSTAEVEDLNAAPPRASTVVAADVAPTAKCRPGDPMCGMAPPLPPLPARAAPAASPATLPDPAARSTAPKANCDPPYYFAPNGNKVFKRECTS